MRHLKLRHVFGMGLLLLAASAAQAQSFAQDVISYDAGTSPALKWPNDDPYTNSAAALGAPDGITEGFAGPNILSVFNPAAELDEIVSVGEGGHLTLRLANELVVGTGPSLGIFSHVGLAEGDWGNPSGTASDPVMAFGADPVLIDVSTDGSQWVSLGIQTIDAPTNFYADAASPYLASGDGLTVTDFSRAFTAPLSDFAGKTWPQILALLDGSGGGTWLDLSSSGLSQVSYVRFSVADDSNAGTRLNFELDAVSIAAGHIGAPVPEPATLLVLAIAGLMGLRPRRRA